MSIVILLLLLTAPIVYFLFPEYIPQIFDRSHTRTVRGLIRSEGNVLGEFGFLKNNRAREQLLKSVNEAKVNKTTDSRLTLEKRLKYAQWRMSPLLFHTLETGISLFVFACVRNQLGIIIQLIAIFSGPLFMRWLLNFMMERRFKRFDADYPQLLMSVVALLKTGMTPLGALENGAKGLEDGSLVKEEVELMIERLRLGVSEDKSIGVFGEDIYHPEIELFVQALLLSRRVGGNLSDTLERLARQVRKRQYFRNSASAAIGMQRGSIWIILALLAAVQVYIYFTYPSMMREAIANETGWQFCQGSLALILLGIFWIRQVTKMKI